MYWMVLESPIWGQVLVGMSITITHIVRAGCAVVVADGVVLASVVTNPEADPLRSQHSQVAVALDFPGRQFVCGKKMYWVVLESPIWGQVFFGMSITITHIVRVGCAVVVADGVVLASVMTNPEADPLR